MTLRNIPKPGEFTPEDMVSPKKDPGTLLSVTRVEWDSGEQIVWCTGARGGKETAYHCQDLDLRGRSLD